MTTNNKLTLRGILRGGKTLILTEDTQLPQHLPDVPVTIQIELPVGIGLLQAYGAWKDMPGIENLDDELNEVRYGQQLDKDDPYQAAEDLTAQTAEAEHQRRVADVETLMAKFDAVAEGIEGEFDSAQDLRAIREERADRL
jgi:hypothetical protein